MKAGRYMFLIMDGVIYWVVGEIDENGEYFIGGRNFCPCEIYSVKEIPYDIKTYLPTLSDIKDILLKYSTIKSPTLEKSDVIKILENSTILTDTKNGIVNLRDILFDSLYEKLIK